MTETATQERVDAQTTIPPEAKSAGPVVLHSAPISFGTFMPGHLRDAMEFAKVMAQSGPMVPKHCQGQPGVCLGITMRALHWGAEPFAVAEKSYYVPKRRKKRPQASGRGAPQPQEEPEEDSGEGGKIAYEASLIHAVIQKHGNLKGDLSTTYEGEVVPVPGREGEFTDKRRIKVVGTYVQNGVEVTREYTSPEVCTIAVKNSPLWTADLEQQLHYYGTRAWARRWRPGIILGVYTREEILESRGEVSDADRAYAIEHRPDVLEDDPITRDPDQPLDASPLSHRFSYALEQVAPNAPDPSRDGVLKKVYLDYQHEIEMTGPDDRTKLRGIYELHLRRIKGDIAHDEAMSWSRAIRAPDPS